MALKQNSADKFASDYISKGVARRTDAYVALKALSGIRYPLTAISNNTGREK